MEPQSNTTKNYILQCIQALKNRPKNIKISKIFFLLQLKDF